MPLKSSLSSRGRILRRDLSASCVDAAAFGGMVGFGETYFVAFALAVGLSELMAGLVGSVPLVVGGVLQLASPHLIRRLGSHKRYVVWCAAIQAVAFVPLGIAAWRGTIGPVAVLAIASVYWGAGLATGPAWNTWIGTLVPPSIRTRYFALRTRASQVTVLMATVIAGGVLHVAQRDDWLLPAFAMLFAAAALCRVVSVISLALQSEPSPIPADMRHIPLRRVIGHLRGQTGGRLLVYLVAVQAAAQFSGPYFTPYMFQQLHLGYGEFVMLIAVSFLAKVIALPFWGKIAQRIGASRLLWVGGLSITPISAGWMISDALGWLIVLQIAAGVAWAAYELAFFLLLFDSIAVEERTSLLTLHNLLNTIAWVVGALAGGWLLQTLGADYDAYLVVFGLSTVGRAAAIGLLARIGLVQVQNEEIELRPLSVRPNSASLDAPVVASLADDEPELEGRSSDSEFDESKLEV